MGCFGCCKDETKVRAFKAQQSCSEEELEFDGPLKHRECRDVPCFLLFVAFLVGSVAVTGLAVKQGNPYRLIYGVDSWGNVCNQDNADIPNVTLSGEDNSNKPRVFFFDPTYFLSLMPNNVMPKITDDETQVICVEKCPDGDGQPLVDVADFLATEGVNLCRYDVDTYEDDREKCPFSPVPAHISKFNRCIPKVVYDQVQNVVTSFGSVLANTRMGGNITETIISDLVNTWRDIGYLGIISVVVAFLVVALMRFLAAIIVWTIVLFTVGLCLGASAYSCVWT